jgi:hypothetical protein
MSDLNGPLAYHRINAPCPHGELDGGVCLSCHDYCLDAAGQRCKPEEYRAMDGQLEPLAARDARQRKIGAAEWLAANAGEAWLTQSQGDVMRQIAEQLRKGGE